VFLGFLLFSTTASTTLFAKSVYGNRQGSQARVCAFHSPDIGSDISRLATTRGRPEGVRRLSRG